MKIVELRQKSKDELGTLIREKQSRIEELRFLLRQNKTKNVKEIKNIRKDIARIMTIVHESQL